MKWLAVSGLPDHPHVEPLTTALLERFGVGPAMPGRATPQDLPGLSALVPDAVEAAQRHLTDVADEYRRRISTTLAPYRERIDRWQQDALFASARPDRKAIDETADRRRRLVESLETVGKPMLRLLAVLEPHAAAEEGTAR
ncbi:hypothetical protein [Actinomadura sp. 3N407]|uniref:hypothetical protein n=1 Tax=Actinomadura sp. 3N407 TaxID=3457423 RepID=UPI003FCD51A5